MTRKALPQNYTIDAGVLLEGFETIGEWATTGGVGVVNTTEVIEGSKSLKITSPADGSNSTSTKTISANLSAGDYFTLCLYVHNDVVSDLDICAIYFSSSSTFTKYFYLDITDVVTSVLQKGWNRVVIPKSMFGNTGGESWSNTMVRLRLIVKSLTGKTSTITFDSIYTKEEKLARCLFTFDDGHSTAYTEGVSYLYSKGLSGTFYIIPSYVDTPQYVTSANLVDADSKGMLLANHTYNHADLSTLTQSEAEAELKNCADWLKARGFAKGAYHVAYPLGNYTDASLAAMDATNMKTGRITANRLVAPPITNNKLLTIKTISNTITLAVAKSYIDSAIEADATIIMMFHQLATPATIGLQWPIADFKALVDYVIQRKIKVVTMDEWYEGLTNPRHRSVPLARTTVQ